MTLCGQDKMKNTRDIFVCLPCEGVDVWRPVAAIHLHDDVYKIPCEVAVPEDEKWQFLPGDTVRCAQRTLDEGPALVAVEKVAGETTA